VGGGLGQAIGTCDAGIRATGPHSGGCQAASHDQLGLPRSLISRCSEAPLRATDAAQRRSAWARDCHQDGRQFKLRCSAGSEAASCRLAVWASSSSRPPSPRFVAGWLGNITGRLRPGPTDSTRAGAHAPDLGAGKRPLRGRFRAVVWPWCKKSLGGRSGRSGGYHQVVRCRTRSGRDRPLSTQHPGV